jgi:hypothetical protein
VTPTAHHPDAGTPVPKGAPVADQHTHQASSQTVPSNPIPQPVTDPTHPAVSVWVTAQTSPAAQRTGRYVPESTAHPAKMLPAVAAHAIAHYTQPGDLVLDPMCGIGTTLIEALHQGRRALGVEYEPHWVHITRANLERARETGIDTEGRVFHGDARQLASLLPPAYLGQAALVVTSPPYGPSTHGQITTEPATGVTKFYHRYGNTLDRGNLANIGHHRLLSGFTTILTNTAAFLRPGGHIAITIRPWREHAELIDLPSQILACGLNAGLIPIERCVALLARVTEHDLIARGSFFQRDFIRKQRQAGLPLHLIAHEDVLVFRTKLSYRSSAIAKASPNSRRSFSSRAQHAGNPRGRSGRSERGGMSTRQHRTTRGPGRHLVTVTDSASTPKPTTGNARGESGTGHGSVCTGYGGLDLGVLAALGGGRIAWYADPDLHIAHLLAARMPGVQNLGDVRAIDWTAVEVLTAGFPCQDISASGRRLGIEKGEHSGLWNDIVAGVRVLRPALLVVENVAALRWKNGGLHRVLGDLAEAGYDAFWRSVRATDIGAAHRRERVFLLAWLRHRARGGDVTDADRARRVLQRHLGGQQAGWSVAVGPVAAAAHADGLRCEEPLPQDSGWWAIAARRGPAAADSKGVGNRHGGAPGGGGVPAATVTAGAPAGGPRGVAADAAGDRREPRAARRSAAPRAN